MFFPTMTAERRERVAGLHPVHLAGHVAVAIERGPVEEA